MVESLHVWGIEARTTLTIYRCQDNSSGISADVIIIALRILEKLEHGLCGFGVLNGKYIIHGVYVQERLHNLALFSPFVTVLKEQQVDLVWTNNFIGDVAVWTAGVDRSPLIEEPGTLSASAPKPMIHWIPTYALTCS